MKRIVVGENDLFDGEEKIPLSSKEMKKVTRWFQDVNDRTNCEITFAAMATTTTKSPPWASIVQTATSSLCLAHLNQHDELPIRGSQINEIMTFIRERVEQQNGGAMYICGSPGTGKSIAVSRAVNNLNSPIGSSQSSSSSSSQQQQQQQQESVWKQRLPQPLPVLRLRAFMARESHMTSLCNKSQSRSLRFDFAFCNAMAWHTSSRVFPVLCNDLRLRENVLCKNCLCRHSSLCTTEAKAKNLLRCRLLHRKGVAQRAMALVVIDEIDGLFSMLFLFFFFFNLLSLPI